MPLSLWASSSSSAALWGGGLPAPLGSLTQARAAEALGDHERRRAVVAPGIIEQLCADGSRGVPMLPRGSEALRVRGLLCAALDLGILGQFGTRWPWASSCSSAPPRPGASTSCSALPRTRTSSSSSAPLYPGILGQHRAARARGILVPL